MVQVKKSDHWRDKCPIWINQPSAILEQTDQPEKNTNIEKEHDVNKQLRVNKPQQTKTVPVNF